MLQSLCVKIGTGPETYAEELAELRFGLRDELLDLDVETVEGIAGESAPLGIKGHPGHTADTLLVTLSNSAVIVALVGLLQSWVRRGAGRQVSLRLGEDSIEINRASTEQQAILIESWLKRHASD